MYIRKNQGKQVINEIESLSKIDGLKLFLKSTAAKKCYGIDVNSRFEKKPGTKNKIKLEKFKKLLYENKI